MYKSIINHSALAAELLQV